MHFSLRLAFAFWPGTLAAWRFGDVRSLMIALLFGAILSTTWVGTTIWPLWMTSWRMILLWSIVGMGAVASLLHNATQGLLIQRRNPEGCPAATLAAAQALYLKANYFEAEQSIAAYCRGRTIDVEAALLLATIYRRTQRFDAAIELLDAIARLERGSLWDDEVTKEKKSALQQKIRSHSDSL